VFDLQDATGWAWLHPQGGGDPEVADADFNDPATGGWNSSIANFTANYNGPTFQANAPGILGYGAIDLAPGIITNITDPGTGNRFTAYFRKEFSLAAARTLWTSTP
jgi:hypothetical protein